MVGCASGTMHKHIVRSANLSVPAQMPAAKLCFQKHQTRPKYRSKTLMLVICSLQQPLPRQKQKIQVTPAASVGNNIVFDCDWFPPVPEDQNFSIPARCLPLPTVRVRSPRGPESCAQIKSLQSLQVCVQKVDASHLLSATAIAKAEAKSTGDACCSLWE